MSQDVPTRIGIFAAQRLVVDVLRDRLNAEADFTVVVTGENFDGIQETVRDQQLNLLIVDPAMERQSVFESLANLRSEFRSLGILLLGTHPSNFILAQILEMNLGGYLLKSESVESFIDHIRKLVSGEKVFSSEVRDRIVFEPESHSPPRIRDVPGDWGFSPRQMDVFLHLARGMSVKEVARVMQLSPKSVDSHKYRIMGRLGLHDRVELTLFALREHLIDL